MTAPQFLAQAAELDAAIQRQDRLVVLAMAKQSPFLERTVAVRNELVKTWASVWRTKSVAP